MKLTRNEVAPGYVCTPLSAVTECQIMSNVVELLLAQIWNSQWFHQPLVTTDGQTVRVVYPGLWSHGFGPDFRNAMLELDGRLVSGDIEVELDASGWVAHGHDRNDSFDGVILQVVATSGDLPAVRTSAGAIVPRVILPDYLRGPIDEFPTVDGIRPLGAIGFDTCAAAPAADRPDIVRDVCERSGDRRMQEKVSAISGELATHPPAQVLEVGCGEGKLAHIENLGGAPTPETVGSRVHRRG
jgi:hypothetical protein